jgi:hypothetical protein
LETIVDGVTGLFFDQQTPEALAQCILEFEKRDWNSTVLQQHARTFGREVFQMRMHTFLRRAGCPIPTVGEEANMFDNSPGLRTPLCA